MWLNSTKQVCQQPVLSNLIRVVLVSRNISNSTREKTRVGMGGMVVCVLGDGILGRVGRINNDRLLGSIVGNEVGVVVGRANP